MFIGRQAWTYRDHEDYDPNEIGAISQARVMAALVEAGKIVWTPFVHSALRSDLAIEEEDGRFSRVQAKTGHVLHGAVHFPTQSLRAARRETEWRRVSRDYQGSIEYFGVYCPDNGKVYLVPIEDVPTKRAAWLRLDPPKNNQKKGIRWAEQYEVRPALQASQLL
jgi:hypothetical protein